jgi:aminomethyltransferase
MRHTPLYEAHVRLGAKIVDFGGWAMPVSYPTGILEEHRATRTAVGVFDVCHMGEVHFTGAGAGATVQRLITNDVARLENGRALYTVACLPSGGIVDDLIVYRLHPEHYVAVVNASNADKDVDWFQEHRGADCKIDDASARTGLIAFQGPAAEQALQPLASIPLDRLRPFSLATDVTVGGFPVWIARTGYTGEDGFELFCDAQDAAALWDKLITAAGAAGGKPVGLGARDTLRLEARLPLYGNDLSDETTPLEAGLGWVVKLDGDEAFASCRDGSLAVVRETSAGVFEVVQTVKTPLGARTMGIDPTNHTIYLPTADFEAPKPGATGRPVPKPGTFKVVVVARQH